MANDNKVRNKYLFKNTAIFAVGNFASKFISFFLVPLYTNCLMAAEYGTVDLLYTLCNFLVPLFTLNIVEAVLRFSLDKNANEKKIIRIAVDMILPLVLIGALSIPILGMFDNYRNYVFYFYVYMVTHGLAQIFLVALKGQEKLKKYAFGNVLHTLFIAVFNIAFLLWMKMGIEGYFLAYILANIIVTLYAIVNCHLVRNLKGSTFDKKLFGKMVKYSAVLMPTSFMWWIMNFLDRVMITSMIGVGESGIYAVSYKLPTILATLSSVFIQAWLFSAIKNDKTEGNTKYTNQVFRAMTLVLATMSIVMLIFIKEFFKVYVGAEYYIAWEYVSVLMIGHIFLTLSTFISTSYNVNKDSKGFLYSAAVGALVNLVLNAILIPTIGVQGAAIATTISYMAVFSYRLYDTRKYLKIRLTLRFFITILSVAMTACSLFIDGEVWGKALQLLSVIIFVGVNYRKGCLRLGARRVLRKI